MRWPTELAELPAVRRPQILDLAGRYGLSEADMAEHVAKLGRPSPLRRGCASRTQAAPWPGSRLSYELQRRPSASTPTALWPTLWPSPAPACAPCSRLSSSSRTERFAGSGSGLLQPPDQKTCSEQRQRPIRGLPYLQRPVPHPRRTWPLGTGAGSRGWRGRDSCHLGGLWVSTAGSDTIAPWRPSTRPWTRKERRRVQYIGGKTKSGGAQIAAAINATIKRHQLQTYVEPFCGGLSVTSRVRASKRLASDACEALVSLYRAIQGGWSPPRELSREEWLLLRETQDPADPLTAFAGFGCSFGGAWFGSYVKRYKFTDRWVPAAEAAAQSLERKLGACSDVAFGFHDYCVAPKGELVYCDPPYAGTMGYGAVDPWDPVAFWAWATEQGRCHRMIAVSEISAPAGWASLLTFDLQHRIGTAGGKRRVEHLFVPEAQRGEWSTALPATAPQIELGW